MIAARSLATIADAMDAAARTAARQDGLARPGLAYTPRHPRMPLFVMHLEAALKAQGALSYADVHRISKMHPHNALATATAWLPGLAEDDYGWLTLTTGGDE